MMEWGTQHGRREKETIRIPSKHIISILLSIALLTCGFYAARSFGANYTSSIVLDEIPEVLHLDAPPLVPDDWDIQSIEKFDDGFTNPHIIIRYDNKIRLSILSGDVDFSREYKKQEPIVLQDKGTSVYGNDRQSVYVIRVDGLYYAFLFTKESRREVEDAVVRLLGRSRI